MVRKYGFRPLPPPPVGHPRDAHPRIKLPPAHRPLSPVRCSRPTAVESRPRGTSFWAYYLPGSPSAIGASRQPESLIRQPVPHVNPHRDRDRASQVTRGGTAGHSDTTHLGPRSRSRPDPSQGLVSSVNTSQQGIYTLETSPRVCDLARPCISRHSPLQRAACPPLRPSSLMFGPTLYGVRQWSESIACSGDPASRTLMCADLKRLSASCCAEERGLSQPPASLV